MIFCRDQGRWRDVAGNNGANGHSGSRQSWGAPPSRKIQPFSVIEPIAWQGESVPERQWLVHGWVPKGAVVLLTGDGGVGKSLLAQQMLTAAAVGKDWLDQPTLHCKGFGIFCEDEPTELMRRQAAINAHYGIQMAELEYMTMQSRVGMDNIMMDFDRRTDHGASTKFFEQVEHHAKNFGAQLIVIDTAADTFGGNENIRTQVRQFVNLLRRLANAVDGAVVLTAHPSVSGMQTGSGQSGSTAWNNTVRQRAYLTHAEGDEADPDERVLKGMKANYGRRGAKIRLKWEQGVFRRIEAQTGPVNIVDRLTADQQIMAAMRTLFANGTEVAANKKARTNFVALISEACPSIPPAFIRSAEDRLIADGKIVRTEARRDGKRRVYLLPADLARTEETRSASLFPAGVQ